MWMYTSPPALLLGISLPFPTWRLHLGGWRGLFTFNVAIKLLSGAWERDETFQLGSSLGCPQTGPGTTSDLSSDGQTTPLALSIHTHLQSHCTPTLAQHTTTQPNAEAHGQTVTLRHTSTSAAISLTVTMPNVPPVIQKPWDFPDTRPGAFIPSLQLLPQTQHLHS